MITLKQYENMTQEEKRIYFLNFNMEELKDMDTYEKQLFYGMKEGLKVERIKRNMQDDYEIAITPTFEQLMGW